MKTLSHWAYKHPWPARMIIVICHGVLICIAIVLGILLQDAGIQLPAMILTFLTTAVLILLLRYPSKRKQLFAMSYTYTRAKLCDLALVVSGFYMVMSIANQNIIPAPRAMPVQMMIVPLVHQIPLHKVFRHDQKELRQEVKQQIRGHVKNIRKGLSGWAAILIALGFVLAFILSLALIAALSCSIACAGSDVLAVAVFLGGLWLSTYLLVIGFRWLIQKRKERNEEVLPETPDVSSSLQYP